jgi:serine protease Do
VLAPLEEMMPRSRTTFVSTLLIAVTAMAVGMVIASRFNLAPPSAAQSIETPVSNSSPISGNLTATTFREIAEAQTAMVVTIWTRQPRQQQGNMNEFGGNEFFRRFFGEPQEREEPRDDSDTTRPAATGTGFVIDRAGLILTNNHVIENATNIEIHFFGDDDDERYEARVLGRDRLTDSALLELVERPDRQLPVATFGDSSQMAPGDWVMAIGAPFGLSHTVTVGVISALARPLPSVRGRSNEMLQTDAAINPGNSGGPLLNIRGEVVGMNTAIVSDRRSNAGVGFAVPINTVRDLLGELRGGKVTRGVIGIQIRDVPRDEYAVLGLEEPRGVIVSLVSPDGPADQADMEAGDVIVEYGGDPVDNTRDLQNRVVATRPGTTVQVDIVRNGEPLTLDVTIGELDLEVESRPVVVAEETSEGFGITLQDMTPPLARRLRVPADTVGAVVVDVQRGSPAEAGGLQPGDVILSINRVDVASASDATAELGEIESGRTAFLLVQRRDTRVFLQAEKE